jgi:hypothetical protein
VYSTRQDGPCRLQIANDIIKKLPRGRRMNLPTPVLHPPSL